MFPSWKKQWWSFPSAVLWRFRFNTISISDAMSMGTEGMRYSLLSREIIADSIETVTECMHYDANVSIPNCDKNMPGVLIAQLRIDRPSIVLYGGSMLVKKYKGWNFVFTLIANRYHFSKQKLFPFGPQQTQAYILVKSITSRERPKSAPNLRLKNSKRTSKCRSIGELATLL